MKSKLLNLGLIITSLFGYLEWGVDNYSFLFEIEGDILLKLFINPSEVIHPLVLLPLIGQLLLLITLFQKEPNKLLTYIGMGGMGLLMVIIFTVGIISKNFKIVISTIPFLVLSVIVIKNLNSSRI
jgi:hypothetical protein